MGHRANHFLQVLLAVVMAGGVLITTSLAPVTAQDQKPQREEKRDESAPLNKTKPAEVTPQSNKTVMEWHRIPLRKEVMQTITSANVAPPPPPPVWQVEVTREVKRDTSGEVKTITPIKAEAAVGQEEATEWHRITLTKEQGPSLPPLNSGTVQRAVGQPLPTTLNQPLTGVGAGFTGPHGTFPIGVAPSDVNGAVGMTQYFQWVNKSFAIFKKTTGEVLYGPAAGNTLWRGFGGPCEKNNDGDPIVQYDKAARRWVVSQFSFSGKDTSTGGPNYRQCIAISQTDDATGKYFRYEFRYDRLNDYPKMGVWSNGYYFTYDMFDLDKNTFEFVAKGAKVCAFNRDAMLAGQAASQHCIQLTPDYRGLLPADLDGSTPPPLGSPQYLLSLSGDSLKFWKFYVDWSNASNTRLIGPITVRIAPFMPACEEERGTCVPQPTIMPLTSYGDRLMYRLAYRNFGTHESLVVNHSVATANVVSTSAGTLTAIRWYELRELNNLNGTPPVVHNSGTFAPDGNSRWMGSMAMDKVGNIALGYNVSGKQLFPSVRYTGRAPSDPHGELRDEQTIQEGGSTLLDEPRWGDYSALTVDPEDDCTLWYSAQYVRAGNNRWSTVIRSFRFNTCH